MRRRERDHTHTHTSVKFLALHDTPRRGGHVLDEVPAGLQKPYPRVHPRQALFEDAQHAAVERFEARGRVDFAEAVDDARGVGPRRLPLAPTSHTPDRGLHAHHNLCVCVCVCVCVHIQTIEERLHTHTHTHNHTHTHTQPGL